MKRCFKSTRYVRALPDPTFSHLGDEPAAESGVTAAANMLPTEAAGENTAITASPNRLGMCAVASFSP